MTSEDHVTTIPVGQVTLLPRRFHGILQASLLVIRLIHSSNYSIYPTCTLYYRTRTFYILCIFIPEVRFYDGVENLGERGPPSPRG